MPGLRTIFIYALIALAFAYEATTAVSAGWYAWLPGSMSRHRDAVAVGITAVVQGKWLGYASDKGVNRALLERGLNVQGDYLGMMKDGAKVDAALKAAATAKPEGPYYSQDEKGMALFYIAAFEAFGIAAASWYWFYFLVYATSVLLFCLAFRGAELLGLLLVCAHAIVASLIAGQVGQDLNVMQGNRFLGIMAVPAMFHLMFLFSRRSPPTGWHVVAASFQVAVIFLVINARTSAAWILISLAIFWLLARKPARWPWALVAVGFLALFVNARVLQDDAFRDGRAHGAHVFWHSLVTALHNNPARARFGVQEFEPYDDQVGYVLFNRELAARGEPTSEYLVGNNDWIYRTSEPRWDYRWDLYDGVMRDIFLRTVAEAPAYAANSFLVQQPLSALKAVGRLVRQSRALDWLPLILAALGGWLAGGLPVPRSALISALAGVVAPVMIAAAVELRVVELLYIALTCAICTIVLSARRGLMNL